jgi:hypothetical protein
MTISLGRIRPRRRNVWVKAGLRPQTRVELAGRYSDSGEWGHLSDTTRALDGSEVDVEASNAPPAHSSSCSRPWPIIDRIGGQAVQELILASRTGVMQRVPAERDGISLSSVKRVLRSGARGPHGTPQRSRATSAVTQLAGYCPDIYARATSGAARQPSPYSVLGAL